LKSPNVQSKRNLFLFTDKFPYKGGEPFLETEIHYLSEAFEKVIIFPLTGHGSKKLSVPNNVEVIVFETNRPVYVKKLLLKHGWIIVKWFVLEFVRSPHRFKYITQFNWNFKRLIGLLNNAVELKNTLNKLNQINPTKPAQPTQSSNTIYYSYWFNDWASMFVLAKQLGLKGDIVSRTHGFDFDEQQQGRGYHPFRYVELPLLSKIFQVSEYGQKYIKERFPKSKHLHVSRLGVKGKGFNPVSQSKVYQIISCSNFVPLKRVHLIIEILNNFKIPFHWTHFGSGKGMEQIKQKASATLEQNSYTFKGYVPNQELMVWYNHNAVDLFMNVSELEGLPVSLMEAISFGIPLVGCNICGVPEIVNNQTGLLLDLDFEPATVADSIQNFLQVKARDMDYRKGVKQFWAENFDADKNYKMFVSNLN
jgi:glycosyltransferase involved in cell wall biosynthesis